MQQNQNNYDHFLKIIILGERLVGRTKLFQRFVDNIFHESCQQCIIDSAFLKRVLNVYEHIVNFELWDPNGADRFRFQSLHQIYYRRAMGIIMVFDITNKESFNRLAGWHQEAQDRAPEDAVIIIVGTKADLEDQREVTNDEVRSFADVLGYMYIETSAKTGMNVDSLFLVLAKEIIEKEKLKDQELRNIQKPNETKRRPRCIS